MENQFGVHVLQLIVAILTICHMLLAFTADHPPRVTEIIQKAKNECSDFEGGELHVGQQAITYHDLTNDGQPEAIVDAAELSCSTAASLWSGSGGTYLWIIVDGQTYEYLAHKWRVIDVDGHQVLLLAVHFSACGESVGPCYRTLVWREGFRSADRS
jgi:hypothetical protein